MDDFASGNIEQVLAELKQKAKDDPGNPFYPTLLAELFSQIYEYAGDLKALERAVDLYNQALELTPEDHHDRSGLLGNLGNALARFYESTGDLEALERAIAYYNQALELTPEDHPGRSVWFGNLGNALFRFHERTGDLETLERAIAYYNQALELTPEDHPGRPTVLNGLGNALLKLHERTGDLEALERAIAYYNQALELTPEDHPDRPALLNGLGNTFFRFHELTGDLEALERAIARYEQALELAPEGYPDRFRWFYNLGNTLAHLHERTGDLEALERAIAYYNQALELTPEDHPDYPSRLNNLGNALLKLYNQTGDPESLERAVDLYNQALELTPEDHPDYPSRLNNLGNALLKLHERTGDLEALERAIANYEQALELAPEDHPDRPALLNGLGNAFFRFHERTGDLEALERAIAYYNQALELAPENYLDRSRWLNSLGNTLLALHERTGDLEALERAIAYYNQALELTPEDHPGRSVWFGNLGNALFRLYELNGDLKALERAIAYYNQALELAPENYLDRSRWLNSLGNTLLALHERTGDIETLERAIAALRQALELTPEDHPSRPALLGGLGAALLALHERTGDLKTLERAVDLYNQALELTPKDHPDYPALLNNLGNALAHLYELNDDLSTIELGTAAFSRALGLDTSLNPRAALLAGQNWIRLSFVGEKWPKLEEAYQLTLAALKRYIAQQTDRRDLTHTLSNFQTLPALAAWAQVELGNLQGAVTALESGRTFVLREVLERGRRDLERLPWLGYGDLYERFKGAEQEILKLERTSFEHRPQNWLSQMNKAREELERAAGEIREKVGDKHPEYRFLMHPLPFSEIQKLVTETGAPLVYLSATPRGGLALVVQEEGDPQLVRLPGLTEKRLHEVLLGAGDGSDPDPRSYLGAYGRWIENASDREMRAAWFEAIEKALDFLGEALAPLREFLGAEGYNRATLIPNGALAILPLHAARFEDGTYFLEHHTFAYAPSAHALYYALLAKRGSESEPLLAVENPTGDLHFAPLEVEAVREHFARVERFAREEATVEAVKKALLEAGVFHFSGHGAGGWGGEGPRLQLADGVLNLSELLRAGQILDRFRLAVLSACETGIPNQEALNEFLGLPAGFLLAGAPGVAGSLWSVSDAATALLIMRFYEELCSKNADAAEALREAQAWMLRASPEEKEASLTRLDAEFRATLAGTRMSPEVAKGMSDLIKSGGRKAEHPYYWAAFGYYGAPVELEGCGKRREG